MSEQGEATFVANEFGKVTNKRVVYYRNKGWLSGGSREDIPLQHVTSVRMEIARNIGAGLLFFLVGLFLLGADGGLKLFGLAFLATC